MRTRRSSPPSLESSLSTSALLSFIPFLFRDLGEGQSMSWIGVNIINLKLRLDETKGNLHAEELCKFLQYFLMNLVNKWGMLHCTTESISVFLLKTQMVRFFFGGGGFLLNFHNLGILGLKLWGQTQARGILVHEVYPLLHFRQLDLKTSHK